MIVFSCLFYHIYNTQNKETAKKIMFTDRCRKLKIFILQWRKSDTITQLYKNKNFMILFILGIQSQTKPQYNRREASIEKQVWKLGNILHG